MPRTDPLHVPLLLRTDSLPPHGRMVRMANSRPRHVIRGRNPVQPSVPGIRVPSHGQHVYMGCQNLVPVVR